MKVYILPENFIQEPVKRNKRGEYIGVFLSYQPSNFPYPDELQNFRCIFCGWVCFQYSNAKVDAIVHGGAKPKDVIAFDAQCPRCKVRYRVV